MTIQFLYLGICLVEKWASSVLTSYLKEWKEPSNLQQGHTLKMFILKYL